MTLREILAFVLGLIAGGGAIGAILTKKHNKELDDTYAQLSTIRDRVNGKEDEHSLNVEGTPVIPYGNTDYWGHPKADDPRNHEKKEDVEPETDEGEEDDSNKVSEDEEEDPEIEDLEEVPGSEEEATDLDNLDLAETKAKFKRGIEERQKDWDLAKTIFNISDNDYYEGEEDYDKLHVTYHPSAKSDEMYTDEHEEFITETDAKALIGTGLLFFGLRSGDKDLVYIRNKKVQADIEVIRAKE